MAIKIGEQIKIKKNNEHLIKINFKKNEKTEDCNMQRKKFFFLIINRNTLDQLFVVCSVRAILSASSPATTVVTSVDHRSTTVEATEKKKNTSIIYLNCNKFFLIPFLSSKSMPF